MSVRLAAPGRRLAARPAIHATAAGRDFPGCPTDWPCRRRFRRAGRWRAALLPPESLHALAGDLQHGLVIGAAPAPACALLRSYAAPGRAHPPGCGRALRRVAAPSSFIGGFVAHQRDDVLQRGLINQDFTACRNVNPSLNQVIQFVNKLLHGIGSSSVLEWPCEACNPGSELGSIPRGCQCRYFCAGPASANRNRALSDDRGSHPEISPPKKAISFTMVELR